MFFETFKQGSVNCAKEPAKFVNAIYSEDLRATIMAYFHGHFVPEDEKEEKRMALRARNYRIINEDMYQGGVCVPLLKCISRAMKASNYSKRYMKGCAPRTLEQGL